MMKEMFIFTLPLLPHYLALHVMNGADRIMVGKLDSVSSEAVYGVASSLGLAAATVWTAINGSLQPYIFGKLNDGDTASVRKTTKYLLAFYAGLCVVVSLMAPELLMILAPSHYSDGLAAIPPIIGMAFLNALYNVYASIEFYHKKSVGIAVATIVSAGLNIGLNAWLIPIYGLSAAAYTTLIANAVLTFCHYIGYRLADKRKIFSDITFLILSVACIAACLTSSLLYDIIWVRYVIITIIAIIVIIKKEILFKFLKLK
jgi:O-antigen/teichoic acid export membrane protein